MESDVRVVFVRFLYLPLLFLSLLPFACDSTETDGTSSGPAWNLTVDGSIDDMVLSEQRVEVEPDGGLLVTVSGVWGEAECLFTLDIAGGTPIPFVTPVDESPPTATLDVGSSSLNVRLSIGDVLYRGTSGTIIFTAYGSDVDDEVTASLDVGLVGLVLEPKSAVQLQGDFSAVVVNP